MEKADKRKIVLIGTGMVGMSYAYALLNQNLCDGNSIKNSSKATCSRLTKD